jgi:transcriptional regulator with XRE-family HTH domain
MLSQIKIRLMNSGLTQRKLAKRLNIFESHLSDIIHERKVASPKLRKKIARAIKADEAELFPASAQSSNAAPLVIGSETASQ